MNEHLKPVFAFILPELEKEQIDYWVYGGVGIAACKGEFIRHNKDVDAFVKDTDFERVKAVLEKVCSHNNFKLVSYPPTKKEKPKVEIRIDNNEIFSIIPIYPKDHTVEFKYRKGNEIYNKEILQRVERTLSEFRFFTPPNRFIKEIFINHIKARPDKKGRDNFKKDAQAILNSEDFIELGWHMN